MARFSTPGIIRKEKDILEVTTPAGTSVGVVVGGAKRGPVNRRFLVQTDKKLISLFGNPISTNTNDFAIYGGVEFLQESENLYFTRATNGDEKYANLYFPGEYDSLSVSSSDSIDAVATSAYATNSWVANEYNDIQDIEDSLPTPLSASLVIASIGPGLYGEDVGIKLTTSASLYSSATSADVDWQFLYESPESNGDPSSASDAKWKKVFKIDVYTRTTSADSFGTTPEESFLGSSGDLTSPNGTQLNIEQVVNGNSNYIYVKSNLSDGETPISTSGNTSALDNGVDSSTEIGAANVVAAWDFYSSREDVTFNIGVGTNASTTVSSKIASIAASRKDFIGTVQVGAVDVATATTLVSTGNAMSYSEPSYIAKYSGWDQVYDSFNDKNVYVPKSLFGGVLMARTDNVAQTWNAPAGINRGILPVLDQKKRFSETEIGTLYDANINTSKFVKGVGHVMWGQRTAQQKNTALREIAVRRLLLYIENSLEPTLLGFLFEPNNTSTRTRIFSIVDGFMSKVQAGEGVTQYQVVVDETNNTSDDIDNGILNLDIYLTPTRTIENIVLQMVITRSGINLTEVRV